MMDKQVSQAWERRYAARRVALNDNAGAPLGPASFDSDCDDMQLMAVDFANR
ncbi:MAG: hypothetical protein AAF362_02150 [Pseudomonadota bacterium]